MVKHLRFYLLLVLYCWGLKGFCQQKPNILWVTIEDTSPEFIGCYGNKAAHTPNIDKLAKEGVMFTNAFSTGTVCSPSRTAIITGVKTYCTGTGNHRSKFPLPEFMKGFPYYLRQAGYYTTNHAKTDYNITNEAAFIKTAWNESSVKAGWGDRKPGQPFFSVFNFMSSHQSFTMTFPYQRYEKGILENLAKDEIIPDDAFDMPPFYHNTPEMRREMARVYNSLSLTDKLIGDLLSKLKADGLMDSTIIIFYGDHGEGIPRGKTNGIDFGFRVPFVIWFPPMYKHLSPWGTGVVTDELIDFTDLAPTMISLAGGVKPNHLTGRAFMGTGREEPPKYLTLSSDRSDNGQDLVRAVTDGRYFYARNFMSYMPELRYIRYMEVGKIKQLMREDLAKGVLNPLQKSLFEPRPSEFLFDTQNDPWETKNLAGEKQYQSRLKKMRAVLKKEIISKRDIMLMPEGEMAAVSESATPYEYRLNESAYPVHSIYNAANLSGFKDKKTLRQQIKLLDDKNKIVRYWAAMGLLSQPERNLRSYIPKIESSLSDPFPPVAVIASALLYKLNGSEKAIESIQQFILGDNDYWAAMAVNFLLYSNHKEPFIETIQKCLSMKNRGYATRAGCWDFLTSLKLAPNDMEHMR